MNPKVITVLAGCAALMAAAVIVRFTWDKRRKNAVIRAGKSMGFRHLIPSENMPVVFVPLIHKDSKYFLILAGELGGHEAGYFDLYISAGENWFYQSVVMVKNPRVNMPVFQLKPPDWSRTIRQRTCGDALPVPGREKDMGSLRLSSENPEWALRTFAGASPEFFQKLLKGKWTIEGFQGSLFVYRWGKTIYSRQMREYVRQAGEIAAEMYSLCT
jgi:hypothetical protein